MNFVVFLESIVFPPILIAFKTIRMLFIVLIQLKSGAPRLRAEQWLDYNFLGAILAADVGSGSV